MCLYFLIEPWYKHILLYVWFAKNYTQKWENEYWWKMDLLSYFITYLVKKSLIYQFGARV